jgi:hypothetical protein
VRQARRLRLLIAVGAWTAASACLAPPVESPATRIIQQTPIRVRQDTQNMVDVLFMIDNSPSMDAMQTELEAKFGEFLQVFTDLAANGTYADLHLGVVTSDYGAGDTAAPQGCDRSPGGQLGHLQAMGAAADKSCAGLAPQGSPFIHYAFGANGATTNLAGGATDPASLVKTFTCMASVGSQGCGFEHQLESVYAALTNTKENAGFLRPGALLTVVFVTNEDDGSAPPATHIFENSVSANAMYGAWDTYRQTRFGVACGSPLALAPYAPSNGPLAGCVPAENDNMVMLGDEYDVSTRYIPLFTQPPPIGVVDDPASNVILVGIQAPTDKFQIVTVKANTGCGAVAGSCTAATYQPCSTFPGDASCLVRLDHSCQNHVQPGFFGDPAIRLEKVINAVDHHQIASICGSDLDATPDYSGALKELATLISSQIKPGCVPAPLVDANGNVTTTNPDCVIEDVTTSGGVTHESLLPRCTLDGTGLPATGTVVPCWYVHADSQCAPPASPQGVGIRIFRGGQAAPPGTVARVECSTRAVSGDGGV